MVQADEHFLRNLDTRASSPAASIDQEKYRYVASVRSACRMLLKAYSRPPSRRTSSVNDGVQIGPSLSLAVEHSSTAASSLSNPATWPQAYRSGVPRPPVVVLRSHPIVDRDRAAVHRQCAVEPCERRPAERLRARESTSVRTPLEEKQGLLVPRVAELPRQGPCAVRDGASHMLLVEGRVGDPHLQPGAGEGTVRERGRSVSVPDGGLSSHRNTQPRVGRQPPQVDGAG